MPEKLAVYLGKKRRVSDRLATASEGTPSGVRSARLLQLGRVAKMLRGVLVAAVFYAYGHPHFDGYRPAAFDRPLQSFYLEMTQVVRDGRRTFDNTLSLSAITGYAARIGAQVRANF
jgi:hypothetical protein